MRNGKHISNLSLQIITFLLILLWVPVTIDKFWDLDVFHATLLNQPFPNWWADILYWLLPLLELLAVILLAWPGKAKALYRGMWLSFILLLGFTLYIAFGVLGFYSKQPCGCGSVIKNLSWPQHLLFNISFLTLSGIGIWLSRRNKIDDLFNKTLRTKNSLFPLEEPRLKGTANLHNKIIRYKQKFAVFRPRP